jgi:hypothetical protein
VASAGGTIQKIFPSYKKKTRKKSKLTVTLVTVKDWQAANYLLYPSIIYFLWLSSEFVSHQQYFYKASNLSLLLYSKNVV